MGGCTQNLNSTNAKCHFTPLFTFCSKYDGQTHVATILINNRVKNFFKNAQMREKQKREQSAWCEQSTKM